MEWAVLKLCPIKAGVSSRVCQGRFDIMDPGDASEASQPPILPGEAFKSPRIFFPTRLKS
jgi:hypothetical protein